jgi:hypothetical protein
VSPCAQLHELTNSLREMVEIPKMSFPAYIEMTKETNKFVNMAKFITKEFVKVYELMPDYEGHEEELNETRAIIASWRFGKKGKNEEAPKREYTMNQLIQILTDKSEDGTSKATRSLINRKIFRRIIKQNEDSFVLGNRKIK